MVELEALSPGSFLFVLNSANDGGYRAQRATASSSMVTTLTTAASLFGRLSQWRNNTSMVRLLVVLYDVYFPIFTRRFMCTIITSLAAQAYGELKMNITPGIGKTKQKKWYYDRLAM